LEEVAESVQQKSKKQENAMKSFLDNYGFRDIDGSQSFRIGGEQIDACGGIEDTFLVIDCHTSDKRERKSIREKLTEFKGKIPNILNDLQSDPKYAKYKNYQFIVYLKNVDCIPENESYATQPPEVKIWKEEFIDYYEDLYRSLGEWARYNFYGEIGIPKKVVLDISIPAIQLTTQNHVLYYFIMNPRELLKAAYVARREVGGEQFYQRLVELKRLTKIAQFIDSGGFFPNNIVIGFDTESEPKFNSFDLGIDKFAKEGIDFGILKFPDKYRSCWIIDGQHRLYAFSKATTENPRIGVVAFKNIPKENQAKFFIDINKEQRRVAADLIWDLEGEMRPTSDDGKISNIVKQLNFLQPLEKKIYIPLFGQKKIGMLKMSGLCIAIKHAQLIKGRTYTMKNIEQKNPFFADSPEEIVANVSTAISKYFEIIDKKFEEKYKSGFIFTNGGIAVTILLFEKIVDAITKQKKKVSDSEIIYYLSLLNELFEEKYNSSAQLALLRRSVTSNAGKDAILSEICANINNKIPDKNLHLEVKLKIEEIKDLAGEIEAGVRNLVKSVLLKKDDKYFKRLVPYDVREEAEENKQSDVRKNPSLAGRDLIEWVGLGESYKIIEQKNVFPDFEKIFVNPSGFTSKGRFIAVFRNIIDVRNKTKHEIIEHLTPAQIEEFKYDAPIFKKCIDDYLSK